MSLVSHPRIVVGIDDSLSGLAAIRAAVAEARRRGLPLHAVRAEPGVGLHDKDLISRAFILALGAMPTDLSVLQATAAVSVTEALCGYTVDPSDLIVVGRGSRSPWIPFRAGRVGRTLMRRAKCSILAVPAVRPDRDLQHAAHRLHFRRVDIWEHFDRDTAADDRSDAAR